MALPIACVHTATAGAPVCDSPRLGVGWYTYGMTPELSEQQRQAVRERPDEPVDVVDAVTQSRYVLLPASTYQRVQALLEEDAFDVREAYPLMDRVAASEGWDDAGMDAYNTLDPRRKP